MSEHVDCGDGDEQGPYESDCACRGTSKMKACARTGCGFCNVAAGYEVKLNKRPWVEGNEILQGEHEADIGSIGLTWNGIKDELAQYQAEVTRLRAALTYLACPFDPTTNSDMSLYATRVLDLTPKRMLTPREKSTNNG